METVNAIHEFTSRILPYFYAWLVGAVMGILLQRNKEPK